MSTLFFIILLPAVLTVGPAQTVVAPGEARLSEVAKRALKDESAAIELRALNGLDSDVVKPGTALKLPGPDRELALSALAAARNAVARAGIPDEKRTAATAQLRRAEALLRAAKYGEAAKAADEAWQQVSRTASEPTRFAVEVEEDGHTRVGATSGQPVRVEAQGVVQPVYAGQEVEVAKGGAPRPPLQAPVLRAPEHQRRLKLRPTSEGLGPVLLAWQATSGATRYEVALRPEPNGQWRSWESSRADFKLPPLPAGRYVWQVRALRADGRRGPVSQPRTFELLSEPLRLEVKGGGFE